MIMSQLDEKHYWYHRMYEFLQRESHPADTFTEVFHTTHFLKIWCYIHSSWEKNHGEIFCTVICPCLYLSKSPTNHIKYHEKIVLAFLSSFGAELVYTILLNILRCEQIISLTVLIRKQQSSFMLLRPNIEMAAEPQPDLKLSVDLDSSLWVAAEG